MFSVLGLFFERLAKVFHPVQCLECRCLAWIYLVQQSKYINRQNINIFLEFSVGVNTFISFRIVVLLFISITKLGIGAVLFLHESEMILKFAFLCLTVAGSTHRGNPVAILVALKQQGFFYTRRNYLFDIYYAASFLFLSILCKVHWILS